MAETYFPFDAGAGANVAEAQWRKMAGLWRPSGVVWVPGAQGELQGYGDSTGMQVKLRAGAAWIKGHYYENDAERVLPIAANGSGSTRLDYLAIRADFTANTITAVIIQGTTSLPALTQTTAIWEIPIAQVAVPNGAASITAGNVTDKRNWSVDEGNAPYARAKRTSDLSIPNGGSGTTISFTAEDEDNDAIHDNSTLPERLTCRTRGLYSVGFTHRWASSGGNRQFDILKNGGFFGAVSAPGVGTTRGAGGSWSVPERLEVGDYFHLVAWQDSGAALNLLSTGTYFWMKFIGQ